MVITKKLKELTKEEMRKCEWIEKIAYRGNTNWTMYDEESGFCKIKDMYPEAYEEMEVIMGKKWFSLYREGKGKIDLIDMAKMDIGEGQEEATAEIKEFTSYMVESGKVVFVIARRETSYFSFVKLAANGEIEVLKDEPLTGNDLRDMIFVKAEENADLDEQKTKYTEILEEFMKNKENHKENRRVLLERYIKELEAEMGKDNIKTIIER